jgi:microsomal dipeptidase-like Zn-dependent dipeptidase
MAYRKNNWRKVAEISLFPNITHTMEKMDRKENRNRKIMGDNWVNLLKKVWGELI